MIARRTVLAAGLAGAGAVALAACGGDSSSSRLSKIAAGQTIANLGKIKVGEAIAVKVDGNNLLVSRPTEATAICFSAICTHEGCGLHGQAGRDNADLPVPWLDL